MSVRVGFVGTGGIANYHFNHLEKMEDVNIVAVCDVAEERVKAAAERFGAVAHADAMKMIAGEALDALYICVPPFAHAAAEKAAVKKGIPIFVEKPVHLDLKEAKQIARSIDKQGLVSAAGYQDRYQDIIDRLQVYLKDHRPGLVMGYWMGGMPGVAWWRRQEQSGGQHVEQTTHIFDMARYLFGEVKQVFAGGMRGLMKEVPKYNIDDASAVTLFFESGQLGTIFSACYLSVGNRGGIDIWCKDACIQYKERQTVTIQEPNATIEMKNGADFGFLEDRTFIDAVKAGDPTRVRSSYPDAVRSLELSLAATQSMETGEMVKIKGI